jgi:hypothetical protein
MRWTRGVPHNPSQETIHLHGLHARAARSSRLLWASLIATLALAAFLSTDAFAAGSTLYVSPKGQDTGKCTKTAPCKTIGHAVSIAKKGETISVASGTYREQVTITKDISLVGTGNPVIDAAGQSNGIVLKAGADGALVRGFVVEHATFEGILAERVANVTIENNTVRHNDLGAAAKTPTGECAAAGGVPGDCGEGLHLMSVVHSVVSHNLVTLDDGGILVTDEFGPSDHDLISKNRTVDNPFDCGITLGGHNTAAFANGKTQPTKGGVYDNTVTGNVSNDNALKGQGGGILLASPAPGGAVYDNVVSDNTADGNGLAGVTLHSHSPGQDLNGNKITDNTLSHDGLTTDQSFNEKGTVGILVASGVTPLKGTVISGNKISDAHYGIWTLNVPKLKKGANAFKHVTVPLAQAKT